jgi:uncharacterized protein with HEPN domain
VEGEYFYTIKTSGDDIYAIGISPEALLADVATDTDLTLLIAHYLEQIYSDSIDDYTSETQVELIRYDYATCRTAMRRFSLGEIVGYCKTEIRDRYPLIQSNDILRVVRAYIDRNVPTQHEAEIYNLYRENPTK